MCEACLVAVFVFGVVVDDDDVSFCGRIHIQPIRAGVCRRSGGSPSRRKFKAKDCCYFFLFLIFLFLVFRVVEAGKMTVVVSMGIF